MLTRAYATTRAPAETGDAAAMAVPYEDGRGEGNKLTATESFVHAYHTKVPVEAIVPYVEHYTSGARRCSTPSLAAA